MSNLSVGFRTRSPPTPRLANAPILRISLSLRTVLLGLALPLLPLRGGPVIHLSILGCHRIGHIAALGQQRLLEQTHSFLFLQGRGPTFTQFATPTNQTHRRQVYGGTMICEHCAHAADNPHSAAQHCARPDETTPWCSCQHRVTGDPRLGARGNGAAQFNFVEVRNVVSGDAW